MAALPCGEVLLPLRPGQPLFVAITAPRASWGGGAAPMLVPVAINLACGATQPNNNRVARIGSTTMELRSHDTLAGGRAVYTAHQYPWLTSATLYWDSTTWRVGSTNFNTRPRIASTGNALASTAGNLDIRGIGSFFPACPNDMWLPNNGAFPATCVLPVLQVA